MSLCYYLLVYGLSMLTRLLLLTKSFRRSLLNYFISKVVHDLFSFRREVLANGPHRRQVPFSYFLDLGPPFRGSAIPEVRHERTKWGICVWLDWINYIVTSLYFTLWISAVSAPVTLKLTR